MQKIHLDRRDYRLLRAKHAFPRGPLEQLAKYADVSPSTAKRRLNDLAKERIFSETIQIESGLERAVVAIDCSLQEIAAHRSSAPYSDVFTFARFLQTQFIDTIPSIELRETLIVEKVEILLGASSDIYLFLAAESSAAILEVVTAHLSRLVGVTHTHTAFCFAQAALQAISEKPITMTNALSRHALVVHPEPKEPPPDEPPK